VLLPTGQRVQTMAPADAAYVPTGHGSQVLEGIIA
jgi:hypothetical protein